MGWEAGGSGARVMGQEVRIKGSHLLPTLYPHPTQSCIGSGREVSMGAGQGFQSLLRLGEESTPSLGNQCEPQHRGFRQAGSQPAPR